jgi:hypothetical protein
MTKQQTRLLKLDQGDKKSSESLPEADDSERVSIVI